MDSNFFVKADNENRLQYDHFFPDNPTPLLIIKLRHLAVFAHYLGLKWQEFDPRTGSFLARGNSQYLTSTRSSCHPVIFVEYTVSPFGSPNFSHLNNPHLTVPTSAATQFLFGYIPPFPRLSLPGYEIGSIEAIYETANKLDPTRHTSTKIKDTRTFMPSCTLGFSDIIPFTAPMLRMRGCDVSRLTSPAEYTGGLTRHQKGFRVFHLNLKKCLSQINEENADKYQWRRWVLEQYDALNSDFPAYWECEQPLDSTNSVERLPFLERCQTVWEACTNYLVNHNKAVATENFPVSPVFTYLDLVSAQIKHSVTYWGDAWARVKAKAKENRDTSGCWIEEGAHLYWDYLPKIAQTLGEKIKDKEIDEDDVRESWAVMMLRAFCWWRCHLVDQDGDMQKSLIIDPRYIGSEIDVIIF